MPKIASVFTGLDFHNAQQSNLTDPENWLLYDTGFVLKMDESIVTSYITFDETSDSSQENSRTSESEDL